MHTRRSFLSALAAFVGAGKIVSSLDAGSGKTELTGVQRAMIDEQYGISTIERIYAEGADFAARMPEWMDRLDELNRKAPTGYVFGIDPRTLRKLRP